MIDYMRWNHMWLRNNSYEKLINPYLQCIWAQLERIGTLRKTTGGKI